MSHSEIIEIAIDENEEIYLSKGIEVSNAQLWDLMMHWIFHLNIKTSILFFFLITKNQKLKRKKTSFVSGNRSNQPRPTLFSCVTVEKKSVNENEIETCENQEIVGKLKLGASNSTLTMSCLIFDRQFFSSFNDEVDFKVDESIEFQLFYDRADILLFFSNREKREMVEVHAHVGVAAVLLFSRCNRAIR